MTVRPSRLLVAVLAAVALVIGAGAAVASDGDFKEKRKAFMADVAQRLGVSTEDLDNAVKGARVDRVAQALKDGEITQEQADAAKEAIESGEGRGFGLGPAHRGYKGGFGHGPGLGHHGFKGGGLDEAADYLGLSHDELRTELQSGKSLATIAGEKGKPVEGLKAAMVMDATASLDEAVASGRLTEEQKASVVERLAEMIDRMIERTPGSRMGESNAPASFEEAFA